jgi:periplasmic copper chaperone A
MKRLAYLLVISIFLAGCAGAKGQQITVKGAWARPAPAGGNSAAYFTIDNPTGEEDALISAAASVAQTAELHESKMDANGTMSMTPQDSVPIPANATVEFQPAGLHVMLINLPKDLKVGDHFTLILAFKQAGDIQVDVAVREQ